MGAVDRWLQSVTPGASERLDTGLGWACLLLLTAGRQVPTIADSSMTLAVAVRPGGSYKSLSQ
jgi:hypothetical protein